jgi:hypothetical protein
MDGSSILRRVLSLSGRFVGPLAAGAGVLLCLLGWYGVSGEKHEARQLPYLASATVPGAALIVAGAVLAARPDPTLRQQVDELHRLLVEEDQPER